MSTIDKTLKKVNVQTFCIYMYVLDIRAIHSTMNMSGLITNALYHYITHTYVSLSTINIINYGLLKNVEACGGANCMRLSNVCHLFAKVQHNAWKLFNICQRSIMQPQKM